MTSSLARMFQLVGAALLVAVAVWKMKTRSPVVVPEGSVTEIDAVPAVVVVPAVWAVAELTATTEMATATPSRLRAGEDQRPHRPSRSICSATSGTPGRAGPAG